MSAAQLERTSVRAFGELAKELRIRRAPAGLVRAATRAQKDEARHARAMTRLAAARGERVPRMRFAAPPARALAELACENAMQGCVRELIGAAVARHQSRAATDASLRRSLARIARDETRHAALALRIFSWALLELDDGERARLRHAIESAVRDALAHPLPELGSARRQELGMPSADAMRSLIVSLDALVWRGLVAETWSSMRKDQRVIGRAYGGEPAT